MTLHINTNYLFIAATLLALYLCKKGMDNYEERLRQKRRDRRYYGAYKDHSEGNPK